MNDTTCATCLHWHAQPRDPMNLTAPRVGDCRAMPPQLLPVPQRGGMGASAFYPVLVELTPACGQYNCGLQAASKNGILSD